MEDNPIIEFSIPPGPKLFMENKLRDSTIILTN